MSTVHIFPIHLLVKRGYWAALYGFWFARGMRGADVTLTFLCKN